MSNIYETAPASRAAAVTPSDTVALTGAVRGLYVGGAGNIACRLIGDSADVTFTGVPAGAILPVKVAYVRSTNTTATAILALS